MNLNINEYDCAVGYGIGQYYESIKDTVKSKIKLDYLYDKKWKNNEGMEYDGIPVLSQEDLFALKNPLIIVMSEMEWIVKSIKSDLESTGYKIITVNAIINKQQKISGKILKEKYPNGKYEDEWGNKIFFDHTLSEDLYVYFKGENNELKIGKNVDIGSLHMFFGTNGYCSIGENTKIMYATALVSEGKIQIGQDCLMASEVFLRNHDSHHIFDAITHERINYAKDIIIGDQVWIGQRATLLGGAEIGTGSVVGTNAVTSSKFGDHLIIAGSPARVIRENVCWSMDDTDWFNRSCLEECISREALNYL